ncbi:hypothetical protein ACVFI8_16515 [Agarivorans sp. MS3-6]
MYLHLGIKKRKAKRIAYSIDYCNFCEKSVIAELWSYQAWLGVFWLPVIPLGKRHLWLCSECNNETSGRYRSNLLSKLLITLFSLAVTGLLFQPEALQYNHYAWWLRGLACAMSMACVIWLFKHKSTPTNKQQREALAPLTEHKCHFCQHPLYIGLETRCDHCQLKVYRKIADVKRTKRVNGLANTANKRS